MKGRVLPYFLAAVITAFALIPPLEHEIPLMVNSRLWVYLVLCLGGFLGMAFVFTKTNIWVRVLSIWVFITCFTSKATYISFSGYVLFVACLWFYWMCLQNKDFKPILNAVQAIFFLNIVIIVAQLFCGNTFTNFGLKIPTNISYIGNKMMLASFMGCMAPWLLYRSRLNIIPLFLMFLATKSFGLLLSLVAGVTIYLIFKIRRKAVVAAIVLAIVASMTVGAYKSSVFRGFVCGGRLSVWKQTIKLANEHPITGWGPGSFKLIFPALSHDVSWGIATRPWQYDGTSGKYMRWLRAHNFFNQVTFEISYIGLAIIFGFLAYLIILSAKAIKTEQAIRAIAGMAIMLTSLLVYFPDRRIQSVLMIICFIAFFQKTMGGDGKWLLLKLKSLICRLLNLERSASLP